MISGNGNVKKETRNSGTFTKIHSSGTADVVITSGSNCAVTVEDDDNLLPSMMRKRCISENFFYIFFSFSNNFIHLMSGIQ